VDLYEIYRDNILVQKDLRPERVYFWQRKRVSKTELLSQ